jgi:hypothetical protein
MLRWQDFQPKKSGRSSKTALSDNKTETRSTPVTKKIIHPLWTHVPVLLVLAVLIGSIIAAAPYPASVPLHFSGAGIADRYGSPWEYFGITIGLSVLFISISLIIDELWARQENRKTFNWFTLLDDIIVGMMTGFTVSYTSFINSGSSVYSFHWGWFAAIAGVSAILSAVFELLRPYRHHEHQLDNADVSGLKAELKKHLKDKTPFIYWDIQNPGYVSLLTIFLPLVLVICGGVIWITEVWPALILIAAGLLLTLPNGGQRVMVTPKEIVIRWGLAGFTVLRLKTSDIHSAELRDFSPLKDFGGYGIRFNREMKAYYFRGSRGVRLETTGEKAILIGSDRPENLMTVIQAVTETR